MVLMSKAMIIGKSFSYKEPKEEERHHHVNVKYKDIC